MKLKHWCPICTSNYETEADTGAEFVKAERQRQIEEEGWTAEHDDEHSEGQLADAAACYLLEQTYFHEEEGGLFAWPWDMLYWKPSDDRIRNLVKAGALIAAEIDRLLRAKERGGA